MTNNQIQYQRNLETERSNRAQERNQRYATRVQERHFTTADLETARSNLARESETNRHNLATESVSSRQIAELERHNVAEEGLKGSSLAETLRHNMQVESQAAREQRERERSNREGEAIKREYLTKDYVSIASSAAKNVADNPLTAVTGAGIAGAVLAGNAVRSVSDWYASSSTGTKSKQPKMISRQRLLKGGTP